jgi:hypothetical protein
VRLSTVAGDFRPRRRIVFETPRGYSVEVEDTGDPIEVTLPSDR